MPSLRYYAFRSVMSVMRWQQARFPVQDVDAFVRFREQSDRMADRTMHPPKDVRVEKTTIGGVSGDWLIPPDAPEDPLIIYLHGGGILFGWSSAQRRMLGYLTRFAGLRAFGVDYRLMPGNPYPNAHDDCFAVYQALVEQGKRIIVLGESSGGVLTLATLLRAKAAGLPQPLLCALISPTVDYGFKDARIWTSGDPFIDPRYVVEMHKHYIAGNDTSLPDLGPIDADLSGLAPLLVMAAEHDALRGESQRLVEAAHRWNVPIEFISWPHVWHGWHLFAPQLPEATEALKAFADHIRQRVTA